MILIYLPHPPFYLVYRIKLNSARTLHRLTWTNCSITAQNFKTIKQRNSSKISLPQISSRLPRRWHLQTLSGWTVDIFLIRIFCQTLSRTVLVRNVRRNTREFEVRFFSCAESNTNKSVDVGAMLVQTSLPAVKFHRTRWILFELKRSLRATHGCQKKQQIRKRFETAIKESVLEAYTRSERTGAKSFIGAHLH